MKNLTLLSTLFILGLLLSSCIGVVDLSQPSNYAWLGLGTVTTADGKKLAGYWRTNSNTQQYEKIAARLNPSNLVSIYGSERYFVDPTTRNTYAGCEEGIPLDSIVPLSQSSFAK